MNRAFYLSFVLASVFTSGCVLAPGTSPRTPQVSGRVLSTVTHKPVSGATVALHEAPSLRSGTTDSSGHFSLRESRNFHLFVFLGICGPDYDMLSALGDDIDVSHPGYYPQRINPWQHAARKDPHPDTRQFVELKDIQIRPKRQ